MESPRCAPKGAAETRGLQMLLIKHNMVGICQIQFLLISSLTTVIREHSPFQLIELYFMSYRMVCHGEHTVSTGKGIVT